MCFKNCEKYFLLVERKIIIKLYNECSLICCMNKLDKPHFEFRLFLWRFGDRCAKLYLVALQNIKGNAVWVPVFVYPS